MSRDRAVRFAQISELRVRSTRASPYVECGELVFVSASLFTNVIHALSFGQERKRTENGQKKKARQRRAASGKTISVPYMKCKGKSSSERRRAKA